jgi:N-acetylneuraminic acid mutarotase
MMSRLRMVLVVMFCCATASAITGCGSPEETTKTTALAETTMSIAATTTTTLALATTTTAASTTTTTAVPTTITTIAPNAWVKLNPGGSPNTGNPLVYDPVGKKMVLFEGGDVSSQAQTWVYDPSADTWTVVADPLSPHPPARQSCSMVYVPEDQRMLLCGGVRWNEEEFARFMDTWAYDPAANVWVELKPKWPVPSDCVFDAAMVYDPVFKRAIRFGGRTDTTRVRNETWAYDPDSNAWMNLTPNDPVPPARMWHAMVYDTDTGTLILFGGGCWVGKTNYEKALPLGDTWEYDPSANRWTELKPVGGPSARWRHSMFYDPASRKVILYGGSNGEDTFGDMWAYDLAANTWTKMHPAGDSPGAFGIASMAYDVDIGAAILFGGKGEGLADTWAFYPGE